MFVRSFSYVLVFCVCTYVCKIFLPFFLYNFLLYHSGQIPLLLHALKLAGTMNMNRAEAVSWKGKGGGALASKQLTE